MDSFVARQPIFDRQQEVRGYELLFRSAFESESRFTDASVASSKVIADSAFLLDLELLTGGKKAFINVTRDILIGGYMSLLPPQATVVEVLESVSGDAETIAACKSLKRSGYQIALDDYVRSEALEPLVALADIVKIDVLATSDEERKSLAASLASRRIHALAEKVETPAVFRATQEEGFVLFQGYFFRKPEIVSQKDIPTLKLHHLELLAAIHQPDLDLLRLERVIKRDLAFSYKLLRFVNSVAFGLRNEIGSVRQALLILGETEIKKWGSLIAMAAMATDRPQELLVESMTRARFCELVTRETKLAGREQELFLLGLLSTIDAFLGRPLAEIVRGLPIADDMKDALVGQKNSLRDLFDYCLAYERGDWKAVHEQAPGLGVDEEGTPGLYRDALEWCGERAQITGRGAVQTISA